MSFESLEIFGTSEFASSPNQIKTECVFSCRDCYVLHKLNSTHLNKRTIGKYLYLQTSVNISMYIMGFLGKHMASYLRKDIKTKYMDYQEVLLAVLYELRLPRSQREAGSSISAWRVLPTFNW